MIRSIVVPLDGSPFSEHALPVAAAIARRTSAALELVLVREPPVPLVSAAPVPVLDLPTPPVVLDPRAEEKQRRALESYLQSTAARVGADSGVDVAVILLDGSPVEMVAAHAAERGADLIVMTTHGRAGVSRLWLGSVAEGLVRQVTVPMLLVKPNEQKPTTAASPPFRRVLLPLDGSPLGESVIEAAIEVAGTDGVEYTLISVSDPMTTIAVSNLAGVGAGDDSPPQDGPADAYLDSVAKRLRARGLTVRAHPLLQGHAARAILHTAGETRADLIAMATHGRGGLQRFLVGSVADKVLRGAETTVLLRRPLEHEESRVK